MPILAFLFKKLSMQIKIRELTLRIMYIVAATVSLLVGSDILITNSAQGKIFSDTKKIPQRKVALVLGCRPGSYALAQRIDAAAELYHSGKVEYLLVSGDNSRKEYDEPTNMLLYLRRKGVPADHIYRDYAGFRTLDSVVRAKEIFQADKLIIVSQRYHLERALYIAQDNGMDAVGYYTDNWQSPKLWARERLARLKAVIDAAINVNPKFLGKKIAIGDDKQS